MTSTLSVPTERIFSAAAALTPLTPLSPRERGE